MCNTVMEWLGQGYLTWVPKPRECGKRSEVVHEVANNMRQFIKTFTVSRYIDRKKHFLYVTRAARKNVI